MENLMENGRDLAAMAAEALKPMIISSSGWRKVFALEGGEGRGAEVSRADRLLAGCAALALARTLAPRRKVLVGTDTRPTGPALAGAVLAVFRKLGVETVHLGVSAAPEIMAFSRREEFEFFFYISASHNPVGHNGFKFGRAGGVFSKAEALPVERLFRTLAGDEGALGFVEEALKENEGAVWPIQRKDEAVKAYEDFVLLTAAGGKEEDIPALVSSLGRLGRIGIAADFNGSARTLSCDRRLLERLGASFAAVNDRPGDIAHAIVPEAENLETCGRLLERKHKEDPAFILGYMPDNDGDRGNLVMIDAAGKARILPAQTVFALAVLCSLATSGGPRLAVAANGPTSMRIEEVAARCGAVCFRSEVGEANTVGLADRLRTEGWTVPICGEGSNGGSILHPSRVRDPLNTILCILRFLADKRSSAAWLGGKPCSLDALVASLPVYTTTDAFSPLAGMKVPCDDFCAFKTRFEELWEERSGALAALGAARWEEVQMEGSECRRTAGPAGRTGDCRGGLKFLLYREGSDEPLGFVWLRPSGTEPLLRLLVDVKGDDSALHDRLLAHLRALAEEAARG